MNIDKFGKIVINGEKYDYIENIEVDFEHVDKDASRMYDFVKNSTNSYSGTLKPSGKFLSTIRSLPKSKVIFGLDWKELVGNINSWVKKMEDMLLYCSISSVEIVENRVLMVELYYKTTE